MTNPFAAVISFLTNWMNSRGEGSERNQAASAIRLLEAAGGIPDKTLALCVFNDLFNENRVPDELRLEIGNQLRRIITALPDPAQAKSDFAHHQHLWKWTAWLCGRIQAAWNRRKP